MTAKLKHGYHPQPARGGDPGNPESQLLKDHKRPDRAEGRMIDEEVTDDSKGSFAGKYPIDERACDDC